MKQIKNIAIVLVLVLACAMLFTACDNPGTDTTATPEPTGTTDIGGGVAVPEKIAMKTGDVYRIFVWNNVEENATIYDATGPRAEQTKQRFEQFQQDYGVTLTWVANPNTAGWIDAALQPAAAGEPIADIFHMGGPFVIPIALGYGGTAIGSLYENLGVYDEYTNFDNPDHWDQTAIESMGYYNGELLIVAPRAEGWGAVATNQVTFFNKKIVAEAGYTADEMYRLYKEGEWTFDKFREVAIACTSADKGIYGIPMAANGMAMLSLINSNGGAILTANDQGVPEFTADSAKSLTAINFFLDLVKEGAVLTEGGTGQAEENLFKTGKVAMMLTYANRATNGESPRGGAVYQTDGLEYGIIMPPKGPDATDYSSDNNWGGPLSVFKGHGNPAGVVQCLSYYMAPAEPVTGATQQMLLEADAMQYFQDNQSIQTLKDCIDKNVTTSYMAYWSVSSADGVSLSGTVAGRIMNWVNGESTPEIDYAASKDVINNIILETVGAGA